MEHFVNKNALNSAFDYFLCIKKNFNKLDKELIKDQSVIDLYNY